jgi:pectate lyase
VVAFPGAQGFGKDALGGRGGSVCHVTTLADAGPGSLRDCVSQSNRTVVFDVGGWITLASNLGITQNNLTIAGQTAPGMGIGIRGRKVSIGGSHIVLRYLRVRRGILVTTDRDDAMTISSGASNVIVDHCSVSYGTDETLSMPGDEGIGPRNLTLQWSIVAWGLQRNNHSAGSLFTSNQTTIHHTLWAFNKTRNPRARSELASTRGQGGHLDWVNNVIYGWNAPDPVGEAEGWSISHDPFILAGTSNGQHAANAVGNYFVSRRSASYAFHNGTSNFSLYVHDNLLDGNANGVLDVSKSDTSLIQGTPTLLAARIASPEVTTESPAEAYELVLAGAGASFPARDEADSVLISQVEGQGGILIQSERDLMAEGVGDNGYGTLPQASREPGFDSDGDGMPDAWELAHGLNPADPSDGNADLNGDGYTNLEGYLATLVLPFQ